MTEHINRVRAFVLAALFISCVTFLVLAVDPGNTASPAEPDSSAGPAGSSLETNWQPAHADWQLANYVEAVERQAFYDALIAAQAPKPTVHATPIERGPGWSPWDGIAQCETGGNWQMVGSRYSGGLGFANSTWDSFGGREFADNAGRATREQQIIVAERVKARYGVDEPWGCSEHYGR